MLYKKITNNIQELGVIEGTLYCLGVFLEKISLGRIRLIRYLFVAQPIPATSTTHLRPSPKSQIGLTEPNSPLVKAFPRPAEVIAKRFQDGNICIAASNEGQFTGYIWIAHGHYDEDEIRCRYQLAEPDRCVWDFDVYVEPAHRLGRCLARLWDFTNNHLSQSGKHWSFSRIAASNVESIRSHRRLGIQPLFSASFLCIGTMQLMLSTHRPFFHVSLSSSRIPTLSFDTPSSDSK